MRKNLINESISDTLRELAFVVLTPIRDARIHIWCREVLLSASFVFDDILFSGLGHKCLGAMKEPVISGAIVTLDTPVLLFASCFRSFLDV